MLRLAQLPERRKVHRRTHALASGPRKPGDRHATTRMMYSTWAKSKLVIASFRVQGQLDDVSLLVPRHAVPHIDTCAQLVSKLLDDWDEIQ